MAMKNVTKTNLEPVKGKVLLMQIENKTTTFIELDEKAKQKYSDFQIVKVGDEKSELVKSIGKCVVFDAKLLESVTSVKDKDENDFWICPESAIVCLK